MRAKLLASLAVHAAVVCMTTACVLVGVRGFVAREQGPSPTSREAAAVAAELEQRVVVGGGMALCLGSALVLCLVPRTAGGRRLERERSPAPPEESPPRARASSDAIAELEQARRRLARTERIAARREVARRVAHEIKNPLAPIQASIETLRRLRERGSPEFDHYFDEATRTVLAEVRRISGIVREFSDFARMAAPRFGSVDLEAVLRGVVVLHDAPHNTGGRRVTLEAETLRPVVGDADQLTQVFTNLVKNGLEAASVSESLPRVSVVLRSRGANEVSVVVRDNGPGVDPQVRERVFEPSVSTKRDGAGLGLAIVQTIVHEHGGEVRLLPDEGNGAAFEVMLPRDGPPLLTRPPAITDESDAP